MARRKRKKNRDPETLTDEQIAFVTGIDEDDITEELRQSAGQFEDELGAWLTDWIEANLKLSASEAESTVDEIFEEGGAMDVWFTLNEAGVGIWDGRWDPWFTQDELGKLQKAIKKRFDSYADFTGGGLLNDLAMETLEG